MGTPRGSMNKRERGSAWPGALLAPWRVPAFGVVLALSMVLTACGVGSGGTSATTDMGRESAPNETVTPVESTSRPTPAPLAPGLQKALDNTATVRGLSAPASLRVELVARSKLPALLESLLTDTDRRWFANTTTLYRLLGHLRADQDYLTIYQGFGSDAVLGLYSPVDDALWVVHEDDKVVDFDNLPKDLAETLAHEFIHALQDFHFKLDASYEQTIDDLDRQLALSSVVEGDAVTHEAIYSQRFLALPGAGRAFLLGGSTLAAEVPASISRELFFPYTTGADWVRTIVRNEGAKAIDAMLANPPIATALILHPDLRTSGWQPRAVVLPDLAPALGAGWKRESGGTFGEFQVRNYLQLRIRASEAASAAAGWDGDHYDVYVNGGRSVAAFRLAFKDAAEAKAFVEAQDKLLLAARGEPTSDGRVVIAKTGDGNVTARAVSSGSEVVFVIASSEEFARKAIAALMGG